ncbi:MAG: hypothetical protein BGP04_05485 [Rhizobiales bacterium 62-17]|nr:FliM/FliN family flagellar motor switch protein [Hyphomicrobiales bacterium]OJY02771.1 MAG: hypothetical protein BGP04_05485 [Rhizobiales bacterium 62-17]
MTVARTDYNESPSTAHNPLSGGPNLARLPMVPVVFDRIAAQLALDLRQLDEAVNVSIADISYEAAEKVLARSEPKFLAGVFNVGEWNERVVVLLDEPFILTMLERMFGGTGARMAPDAERPLSNLEIRVANSLFQTLAGIMQTGFSVLRPSSFQFEGTERRLERIEIGRRSNPCLCAKIKIAAGSIAVFATIVVPLGALSVLRYDLAQSPKDPRAKTDQGWSHQFGEELVKTEVSLRAVISDTSLTLGEISRLKVNQTLYLETTIDAGVVLESNGKPLYECQLGQSNGVYTARINQFIGSKPNEMLRPIAD